MKAIRAKFPQIDNLEASELRRIAAEISSSGTAPGGSGETEKLVTILLEVASYLEAQDLALKGNSL